MAWLIAMALLPHQPAAAGPAAQCVDAAAAVERTYALPADLVGAIGRVESGRFDPSSGRVAPWPWTVNAEGADHYYNSAEAAIAAVRGLLARGVRLIDVGCFQIDLFYHPGAFATLEQAFAPAANADYAARFLTALYSRTGSWPSAIASYHSALPLEGETYRQKVMNTWPAAGTVTASIRSGRPVSPGADPVVVLMSAAARAVHVIGPNSGRWQRFPSP